MSRKANGWVTAEENEEIWSGSDKGDESVVNDGVYTGNIYKYVNNIQRQTAGDLFNSVW